MKQFLIIVSSFIIYHSSIAFGAAPAQVPQTGQVNCYNESGTAVICTGTGQDGELQTGVAWPSPRFTDNGDQSVTDNLTGLVWTKDANLRKTRDPLFGAELDSAGVPLSVVSGVTWQQALEYVKKLNTESYLGHTDWRLPNINELKSLKNIGQSNPSTWLNGQGFSNVQSYFYWSGTQVAHHSADSEYFGFGNPSTGYYIWPVRSGQYGGSSSLTLPKTGTTSCYDASYLTVSCSGTGMDGELQVGTAWPTPRFTDNSLVSSSDKTVTDNLTGLIWSKDANLPTTSKTWQQALDYIKSLNSISYLGHNDWRLPNIYELESLINKGLDREPWITWLNGYGFTNLKDYYWSSSTSASSRIDAWFSNMPYEKSEVAKDLHGLTMDIYTWPVRGGLVRLPISVTKSGTGSGTVTSSTGGINCGSTCSGAITTGMPVTLTATPDSSSTFTGWTGACSGTGTCTVTMDASKSVTANFTFTATYGACGSSNGLSLIIAPTSNLCNSGTATTVTGSGPWNWFCTGSNSAASCSANIQTWTINTGYTSNGTVSCTSPIKNGATSNCAISPASGYLLASFTDNSVSKIGVVSGGAYIITGVSANHQIAATFSLIPPPQFAVTPTNGVGYSISPETAQMVNQNTTASFTVTPTSGFGISTVTGCNGSLNGTTFTTGSITANCTISVTTVERSASPSGATPTISDALKVLQAFIGGTALSDEEKIRYDVAPLGVNGIPQGNGIIDGADIILILRRSIGIGSW
jgi:uncharacterized repeat protein (TIGR02543 family)